MLDVMSNRGGATPQILVLAHVLVGESDPHRRDMREATTVTSMLDAETLRQREHGEIEAANDSDTKKWRRMMHPSTEFLSTPELNYEQWRDILRPNWGLYTPDDPKAFAGRVSS
jgi:hypothetical protein